MLITVRHISRTRQGKTRSVGDEMMTTPPDYDFEAAFATAFFVAAARSHDASSVSPLIGRTIEGGVPDHCAQTFVSHADKRLFHDFCEHLQLPPDAAASGIALRTAYVDELLMKAYADGTRQFVGLASGLDARPWRLPLDGLEGETTVYEVDCPSGVRFK